MPSYVRSETCATSSLLVRLPSSPEIGLITVSYSLWRLSNDVEWEGIMVGIYGYGKSSWYCCCLFVPSWIGTNAAELSRSSLYLMNTPFHTCILVFTINSLLLLGTYFCNSKFHCFTCWQFSYLSYFRPTRMKETGGHKYSNNSFPSIFSHLLYSNKSCNTAKRRIMTPCLNSLEEQHSNGLGKFLQLQLVYTLSFTYWHIIRSSLVQPNFRGRFCGFQALGYQIPSLLWPF